MLDKTEKKVKNFRNLRVITDKISNFSQKDDSCDDVPEKLRFTEVLGVEIMIDKLVELMSVEDKESLWPADCNPN